MAVPRVVVALGVASAVAAPAHADPDDLVTRPLVLAQGGIELRLSASINLQPRSIGEPVSLAPDAWWGVTPRLTIGIVHSDASLDQIATSGSFCVRELLVSTCDKLYRGSGVDVRYAALDGNLAVAPRLRAMIRDLDPIRPAITIGALVRWAHGRFSIASDPYIRLPLANHELGNRAAMNLPLWLAVQPAEGWLIALHTGYAADLVVLSDGGHGALALGVTARITAELDLGLEVGWGSLFGPQHDARHGALMISAGWRD